MEEEDEKEEEEEMSSEGGDSEAPSLDGWLPFLKQLEKEREEEKAKENEPIAVKVHVGRKHFDYV